MSRSFSLYRLQRIDSQMDRLEARLAEIEIALGQDTALRKAKAQVDQASAHLEEELKSLRRAEEAVQGQRIKIEQTEATLYGGKVRNPKELQDMQNEAAALKRYLGVLEDRQLEAMISVEAAENDLAAAKSAQEKSRAESAVKNSSLMAEEENLSRELERLSGERSAATPSIEDQDLALYEQLRKQRRGVAVAKVSDNACDACGSTLNSTLLNMARLPSQIARCDVCGRILYGG